MSWLGEQFNSITEKLTDFKKEVLNESDQNLLTGGLRSQNVFLSKDELLQICNEKDEKIEALIEEKILLERGIEELDQQHQEAIDELLSLKSQVIKENNELKEKLRTETEKSSSPYTDNSLYSDVLNFNGNQDSDHAREQNSSESNINIVPLLHFLKNCSDGSELSNQVSWLEKQKQLLENQVSSSIDTDVNMLLERVGYYINCLKIASLNSQTFTPVFNEIASVVDGLLVNNAFLKENLKSLKIANDDLKCNTDVTKAHISDSFCQTDVNDFKLEKNYKTTHSSTETDAFYFSNLSVSCQTIDKEEPTILTDSEYSQTEDQECEKCVDFQENIDLISQLKTDICELKFANTSLKQEMLQNYVPTKHSTSVLTQTDIDSMCKCKVVAAELKKIKYELSSMQGDHFKKEEDYDLSIEEQLGILNDLTVKLRPNLILEKDNSNSFQEKEIRKLKAEIDDLTLELKSSEKKRDYGKDVDTCEVAKNQHLSNVCFNCKNVLDVQNSTISYDNEASSLQEKLKTSDFEKNKLLCVLNEKSQECRSLKAEVHKLTSIVASEKQALLKLQQDNCDLKQSSKAAADPELTKEAVQQLSRLVRDKDFEIESLKLKNATLTTLISETSSVPEHLQSLIEERENLSKQINMYKTDREKIMVSYNAKDQECRQYLAEIKKINSVLACQSEKFDILEQEHLSVAQQYEEKQKSLINTQNEMIALKQRVTDLEQQQVDIKEKYSELLNKINSDAMIQMTKEELNIKISEIEDLTRSMKEKDSLIQEKDCMIHDLSQQVKKLKMEYDQHETMILDQKKDAMELKDKLKASEMLVGQVQAEKDVSEQRLNDRNSELMLLREMNERLNMIIKEKEFAVQSMTEKISSLSQYINRDKNSPESTDINQILADSESMFSKAQDLYRERDETLLALSQSQQENQTLRNEIQKMKSNELHLKNELDRFREHLLQIEDTYTSEAVKAEEREIELRNQLSEVKRRAEITSTAVVDTNQRASIQIISLQEQLSMIASQRDQALAQVSTLDDKVQQHSASINNLQFVLEQMQRGTEKKVKDAEKKLQALLEKEKKNSKKMEMELERKMLQLEESSQALEAATRLSEQLDAKEEIISNLKRELSKTESMIKSTTQEIDSIKSNTEGKVDRVVMKSLVLGYFSTPPGQKSEVIRLLARVLDFNHEEMEKAGIIVQRNTGRSEQKGILSSIFSRWPSRSSPDQQPVIHNQQLQKSFTTLFVQFLENESQPIVPLPFPAEKMAQELTSKSHSSKNSQSPQKKQFLGNSPLLLNIDSTFPTFTPVPAIEYTKSPAPSILKEVLE